MFWTIAAWIFTAGGTILALFTRGGELSLWLISFGWVLEVTLGLLVWLGATNLPDWRKAGWLTRVLRMAGLGLVVFSAVFRAQGRLQLFTILSAIATIVWAFALIRLNSLRRNKYG